MLHEEPGYSGPGRDMQRPRSHRYVFISTQSHVHTNIMPSQCLNSQNMFASTSGNSGGPFYPVHILSPTCPIPEHSPLRAVLLHPFSVPVKIQGREKQPRRWLCWQRACHPRMRTELTSPSSDTKSQACLLSLFYRDRNGRNRGSC